MKSKFVFLSIIYILIILPFNILGQDMDCASKVRYRYANKSYTIDEQSKSAICYSGQKYEYNVFLSSRLEYRISFFASPIFNNNIRFKIINISTGELMLNLPGEAAGNNTSAILEDFYDEKLNKFIHPYYDLMPEQDCNYQIIVEVGDLKVNALESSNILVDNDQKKGCVTVFMQSKSIENFGF